MSDTQNDASKKKKLSLPMVIGAAIGMALGSYAGASFLIPAVFFIIAYSLNRKLFFKGLRSYFFESSSLIMAQSLWLLIGSILSILLPMSVVLWAMAVNILEALLCIVLAVLLVSAKKIIIPVILIVIEAIVLLSNCYTFLVHQPGTSEFKSLIVHVVLRIAIIITISMGLKKMSRAKSEIPSTEKLD